MSQDDEDEVWEDVHSATDNEVSQEDDVQEEDKDLQLALLEPVAGPSKGKGTAPTSQKRAVTKADREAAAEVHRTSVLCLLSRTLQLDIAACNPEVQALLLSTLDPGMLQFLDPSLEEQRAINCLTPVLRWFNSQYTSVPYTEDVTTQPIQDQVLAAAQSQSGTSETVVALFVALLRSRGYQARVTRLLDAASLTPWKKLPPPSNRTTKRKVPASKAAAAAIAAAQRAAKATTVPPAPTGTQDPARQAQESAPSSGNARRKGTSKKTVTVTGGRPREAETDDIKGDNTSATQARRNRGDDEFEAQLRMALLATEAEETARRAAQAAQVATTAAAAASPEDRSPDNAKRPLRGGLKKLLLQSHSSAQATGATASAGGSGSAGGAVTPWCCCWAEVWCGSAEYGHWIHVDVVGGQVDRPLSVSEAAVREGGLYTLSGYVLACDSGRVRDVTSRYLTDSVAVRKLRDGSWWEPTLKQLKPIVFQTADHQRPAGSVGVTVAAAPAGPVESPAAAAGTSKKRPRGAPAKAAAGGAAAEAAVARAEAHAQAQLREARESAELSHKEQAGLAGLPTTIDEFKKHPLYVLKRHIAKYQALKPDTAPLGLHKGEPYYPRDCLSELHTADRWRREGRKVRDSELDTPAKLTKKRAQPAPRPDAGPRRYGRGGPVPSIFQDSPKTNSRSKGAGSEEGGEESGTAAEEQTKLYGLWQTDPHIERAEGGKVPRNTRGNVEVPPLTSAMPLGCVHLQYPGLAAICRALNVDFAPALVGFELQGGRMLPKLDGVVVCQEFESQVVAAYIERETARQEALRQKKDREMRGAWMQLLQALLLRAQLEARDVAEGRDPVTGKKRRHTGHSGAGGGSKKHRGGHGAAGEDDGGLTAAQQAVMQRLMAEDQARDAGPAAGQPGAAAHHEGSDMEEI